MATRMQQRRGTSVEWASDNPVLAAGEIGVDTTTKQIKVGDGLLNWADLPDVFTGAYTAGDAALAAGSVQKWKANTTYAAGTTVLNPSGEFVNALVGFTSSATYSGANWSSPASATYAPLPGAIRNSLTGWFHVDGFGAVGNGVTDDSAAIQAALNAVPANGGTVYFPPGIYKASGLTSSKRSLVLLGVSGSSFNEADSASGGSTILVPAGTTGFSFNAAATSLVHQGPTVTGLSFREVAGGVTSTLVRIGAANRWRVERSAFSGGLVALDVDAGNPALDVSWGLVDQATFRGSATGLLWAHGTGASTVIASEFTGCGRGIHALPFGSLSTEFAVLGTKFDSCTTAAIHTKGRNARIYGCGFERNTIGVLIERDAVLHADSGTHNRVTDCLFIGVSTETGVSIGAGCTDNHVAAVYRALASTVTDTGTRTTRHDAVVGLQMDRDANTVPFHKFTVGNVSVADLFSASSGENVWRALTALVKLRIRLAGTASGDEWAVQDSASANLLRVFGNGNISMGPSNTSSATSIFNKLVSDKAFVMKREASVLAAPGNVSISALTANIYEITLQANATSMSAISNGVAGQQITITFVQDATGGRTYVYAANLKFAGGAAPTDTTAAKRTSVTFQHDGTNWYEVGRAVAVG
jgi:hypothetical protein